MTTGDYVTEALNLLFERLDKLAGILERIAIALEAVNNVHQEENVQQGQDG